MRGHNEASLLVRFENLVKCSGLGSAPHLHTRLLHVILLHEDDVATWVWFYIYWSELSVAYSLSLKSVCKIIHHTYNLQKMVLLDLFNAKLSLKWYQLGPRPQEMAEIIPNTLLSSSSGWFCMKIGRGEEGRILLTGIQRQTSDHESSIVTKQHHHHLTFW